MKLIDLHEERIGDVIARWTPRTLSGQEMIEWMKKHARQFRDRNAPIYRGTEENLSGVLNTTQLKRDSANSNGYYNWWLDNSPDWSEYPKRSKSIIASTDKYTADNFDTVYFIVPSDKCKIGMCSKSDIWGSFDLEQFDDIADDLNEFMHVVADVLKGGHVSNWEELQSGLKDTTREYLETLEATNSRAKQVKSLVKVMDENGDDNLFELFSKLLSPEWPNDFDYFDARNFSTEQDREVWVSGEILQIQMNNMDEDVRKYLLKFYDEEELDAP